MQKPKCSTAGNPYLGRLHPDHEPCLETWHPIDQSRNRISTIDTNFSIQIKCRTSCKLKSFSKTSIWRRVAYLRSRGCLQRKQMGSPNGPQVLPCLQKSGQELPCSNGFDRRNECWHLHHLWTSDWRWKTNQRIARQYVISNDSTQLQTRPRSSHQHNGPHHRRSQVHHQPQDHRQQHGAKLCKILSKNEWVWRHQRHLQLQRTKRFRRKQTWKKINLKTTITILCGMALVNLRLS